MVKKSFSCLPDALSMDILLRWCETEHLPKLDTALCNHSERSNFLRLLKAKLFSVDKTVQKFDSLYLYWLHVRHVKTSGLFLVSYHFGENYLKFPIDTSSITSLGIDSDSMFMWFMRKRNPKIEVPVPPTDAALVNLINSCPKLEKVFISTALKEFNDKTVEFLDDKILENIQSLHLNYCCEELTIAGLRRFTKNLTDLNLGYCPGLKEASDEALLITGMSGTIKRLSLLRCAHANFQLIADKCTLLETISISHCERLPSILPLAQIIQNSLNLKEARFNTEYYSRVIYTSVVKSAKLDNDSISVSAVEKSLEITCSFGDRSTNALPGFLNTLKTVNLTEIKLNAVPITDDVLVAISQHNPTLQTFSTAHCDTFYTKTGLDTLLVNCPLIHTLTLAPVGMLSAADFVALFVEKSSVLNLQNLLFSESFGLTDDTVKGIINSSCLPKLKKLACHACRLVTESAAREYFSGVTETQRKVDFLIDTEPFETMEEQYLFMDMENNA